MGAGAIFSRLTAALLAGVLLAGCLAKGQPLVAERSVLDDPPHRGGTYTVRPGDTLYAIAWRFELDINGLARANGLREPFTLRPGQRIRLTTQGAPGARVRSEPRQPPRPAVAGQPRPAPRSAWVWPLALDPAAEFGAGGGKGMDFVLNQSRARVRAANAGEVVYAGNGLGGFERLIILRHGPHLLSAYGFDGESLVAERQTVKAGAGIADIRNRGGTKQSLHFELRRDGAPIDPRSVLR